jgi:hypothetical protein
VKPTTWGIHYWPWYLITAALAFIIPEGIALFTNHQNTLSDYAWQELDIRGNFHHTLAWGLSQAAWVMFAVVITFHIWYRWLR